MNRKSLKWILIGMALTAMPAASQEQVSITQKKNGQTIEVTPIQVTPKEVVFEYKHKQFTITLDQLSPDSGQRLHAWHQAQTAGDADAYNQLNEAIGCPLFETGLNLWDEAAETVAQRLGWRRESASKSSSSYRKYPRPDERFIKTRPYCCTLYGGEETKCDSLSIVFANKGDFNSQAGLGEDHFKKAGRSGSVPLTLNDAISKDIETISTSLSALLGAPTEQRYGEKEDRRNVMRWDFKEHAFILSQRDDEYAHLLIVDRETADAEGKVKFIKDQEVRELLSQNVKRSENGDVVIENIPMVNQGPKGYCAPATFERAMRYMQVPADMYLLATLATMPGGGTNTGALANEAKRIISSKARRIKDLDLQADLDVRLVARYVDKGVPILWQMASLSEYNQFANESTKQRKEVTDFKRWAAEQAQAAGKVTPGLHNQANYHICMIIGYNEATSELAVSDSWGPGYALRWVPVEVAKAVTMRGGFVIDL